MKNFMTHFLDYLMNIKRWNTISSWFVKSKSVSKHIYNIKYLKAFRFSVNILSHEFSLFFLNRLLKNYYIDNDGTQWKCRGHTVKHLGPLPIWVRLNIRWFGVRPIGKMAVKVLTCLWHSFLLERLTDTAICLTKLIHKLLWNSNHVRRLSKLIIRLPECHSLEILSGTIRWVDILISYILR